MNIDDIKWQIIKVVTKTDKRITAKYSAGGYC